MSPSAEPATPAADADTLVPERLLQDGEIVILAVKPSGWFALLVSLPVLMPAAMIVAAAFVLTEIFHVAAPVNAVLWICLGAVCLRALVACFQWMGRLYVLTNRRALRVRGVLRVDVFELPLKHVQRTGLTASIFERTLGVGSLSFECRPEDTPAAEATWTCLAEGEEVERIVNETIRRLR